ncbi:MAG: PQQ-binding-like beta-propeller repeat protein [Phycisphaerae bacterium]
MKTAAAAIVCSYILSNLAGVAEPLSDAERYWPQWRGPHATGVAPNGNPPVEWSEAKNVRWKVEIPGRGNATPIVWGDRVYIQTAIQTDQRVAPEQATDSEPQARQGRQRRAHWGSAPKPTNIHKFCVMALDRRDGKVLWEHTVCEALPHEGGHQNSTQASNSPLTDGEHFFAYFGSRGLYCFDMQGNLQWKKDFGDMRTRNSFGEGSSPVLHGDTIVVNWDHEGDSFIIALNKNTGEELWKTDRDEATSWSTPLVIEHNGKPQVVTSATRFIRSYDLASGELIWQCGGMTMNVIPSPVCGHGMVYALSGFRGNSLLAIRVAGAEGDITGSEAVAWKHGKGTPYVPSPLLYDDTLYFLASNGAVLSCFDARTGKPHCTRQRLEGITDVFASPVGARDRVYVAGRNGTTAVIKRGSEFEVLAMNSLDEGFDASPAIVDNEIYLRGRKHLYCIARD